MWKELGTLILLQLERNGFKLTSMRAAVKVWHACKKVVMEAWLGSLTRKSSNWFAKIECKQTGRGNSLAVNMRILRELQKVEEVLKIVFFNTTGGGNHMAASKARLNANHKESKSLSVKWPI